MKVKQILKHLLIVLTALVLLIGLPFLSTDYFKGLIKGTDAVSSATVIIEAPSGEYVVLINGSLHKESDLEDWISFFNGQEILIFEDISCSVCKGDSEGIKMAQSFQSRLPENQMTIKKEDGTLLMSRADNGLFDVIVMSKDYAEAYGYYSAITKNVEVINL